MQAGVAGTLALIVCAAGGAAAKSPRPSILGEWHGKYECGQGVTALRLTLSDAPHGKFRARFDFGPLPENPLVPVGAYMMEGQLDQKSGRIAFKAGEWIRQPLGYFTVDLEGYLNASGDRITGVVPAAGCTVFDLVRAAPLVG